MREKFRELCSNTVYSLLTLIFVLMIFYYWLDIPTALWINAHTVHPTLVTLSQLIETLFKSVNWLVLSIAAGIIGLYLHYTQKNANKAKPFLFFAFSGIIAFVLCFIIKVILARYRPQLLIDHGLYGFHFWLLSEPSNSMPSGHAAAAFAGLYALARICQRHWVTIVLMVIALFIAVSRILILKHYPSDVICAAYIGVVSAIWVGHFMRYPKDYA